MMNTEMRQHLCEEIIPFWKGLRDDAFGGYYGYMDSDLNLNKEAEKGCILNSRITWFFANAYLVLKDKSLLEEAKHAFEYMKKACWDKEFGGVYWSTTYDGKPLDTTKHTYNQAFAIYALSSYYDASGDQEALNLAMQLFELIESRCTDEVGYMEAFTRDFGPESNDKLSENGVMADKTMNTLLHVFEAYTELYRVYKDDRVRAKLIWILKTFADQIYNPTLHRQEVFFDQKMNSIIDLHSYGHDIETTWLLDRGLDVLGEERYTKELKPMIADLVKQVYEVAFDGRSMANECERGVVDTKRVWWVQAETVVGFANAYQRDPQRVEYLEAARATWEFIKEFVIDKRVGEWHSEVSPEGKPINNKPIVEPWKCPYHNGRMCLEMISRGIE